MASWTANKIIADTEQEWTDVLERGDSNEILKTWSSHSEQYLGLRSFECQAPAAFLGRGSPPKFVQNTLCAEKSHEHGAIELRPHRIEKLTRRVEELIRKLVHRDVIAPVPQEWFHIWQLCQEDGRKLLPLFPGWWAPSGIPDLAFLRALSAELRQVVQSELTGAREGRKQRWSDFFSADWADTRREIFAFVNGDQQPSAPIVADATGALTGDPCKVDSILRVAWGPIFQLYQHSAPPNWRAFRQRFGNYFPQQCPFEFGDLTVEDLLNTLRRMKSRSATGACGWRVAELKRLPRELLERLCQLFQHIEATGIWPEALLHGLITMVPKEGGGLGPTDLRPITVMSSIYRLWSGSRVAQVLQWQELWISKHLVGFRQELGCEDAFWVTALKVEKALLEGEELSGLSLDFQKAFDRVPHEHVFELARAAGLPHHIVNALASCYKNLNRHFKVGAFIGEGFKSTNGILQGCALSVVLLNLLMHVWAEGVAAECPGACPTCYADDASTVSKHTHELQGVLDFSSLFCTLTGMRLNLRKCLSWSTSQTQRALLPTLNIDGESPTPAQHERLLGAQMAYTGQHTAHVDVAPRFNKAGLTTNRIEAVSLPLDAKADLFAACVIPKILFDTQIAPISKACLRGWRTRAARSIWGRGCPARSLEMLFTLVTKGHRCDPLQASVCRVMLSAHRMLRRYAEHAATFWSMVQEGTTLHNQHGPVARFLWALKRLGWQVGEHAYMVQRRNGLPLHILECDASLFSHFIREDMRLALWQEAARRRPDMAGCDAPQGIDRDATLSFATSTRGMKRRRARTILTGAIDTRKRRHRRGLAIHPLCFGCGPATETTRHMLHECHWFRDAREDLEAVCQDMPPCTVECGIVLDDPAVLESEQRLERMQEAPVVPTTPSPADSRDADGHTIIFTDGACKRQRMARLRRAGAGLFYGQNHHENKAWPLPGIRQSNQRAELWAVVRAMEENQRPIHIYTDSAYVHDNFHRWRHWRHRGWQGDHADLWLRLSRCLAPHPQRVKVSKVKAHLTWQHVSAGLISAELKIGNAGADLLAGAGADMHDALVGLEERARNRKAKARKRHRLMVQILEERDLMYQELPQNVVGPPNRFLRNVRRRGA